jgi:hypothetical protein
LRNIRSRDTQITRSETDDKLTDRQGEQRVRIAVLHAPADDYQSTQDEHPPMTVSL